MTITLKSDLCAGSGEFFGVSVDTDLCYDRYGLPYLPAKSLKGCLRAAAAALLEEKESSKCSANDALNCISSDNIDALLGTATGQGGALTLWNAHLPGTQAMRKFLSEEAAAESEKYSALVNEAAPARVLALFTHVRGQTRLENGVADDGSLRFTRVLDRFNALTPEKPTILKAGVYLPDGQGENDQMKQLLEYCCQATRHIGMQRNRGLGWVSVSLEWEQSHGTDKSRPFDMPKSIGGEEDRKLRYFVSLDAPVALPGCDEQLTEIPARSVIGCVASAYLALSGKHAEEHEAFQDLFLNGRIRWSSLTPAVMIPGDDGRETMRRTCPTPLMLVKLKNDTEHPYRNRFAPSEGDALKGKQKTLDGTYAAEVPDGYRICETQRILRRQSHHSHLGNTLYQQASIDEGFIFGGEVTAPSSMIDSLKDLLSRTSFSFGRSHGIQYGFCQLYGEPKDGLAVETKPEPIAEGDIIYAVLQSDLIVEEEGIYSVSRNAVRAAIAAKLKQGALREPTDEAVSNDYCKFHTVGGYNTQWGLQKFQIPAVRGGSVYSFQATRSFFMPQEIRLGAYQQEGFGQIRLYKQGQMKGKKSVQAAQILEDIPGGADSVAERQHLCTAMLLAAFSRRAHEFVHDVMAGLEKLKTSEKPERSQTDSAADEVAKILAKLPHARIGRLRLMLAEAKDYNDFFLRVASMKKNGANAKVSALDLLKPIYGGEYTEGASSRNEPNPRLLLQGSQLGNLFAEDKEAMKRLKQAEWKIPLQILLHSAYYASKGSPNEGTDEEDAE